MNENQSRYAKQIKRGIISLDQQKRLSDAKVIVVGAGGLGSSILYYLSAVGIGNIGIVDDDYVNVTNLNRQILYTPQEIGKKKVYVAKDKIQSFNPSIKIDAYDLRITKTNIAEIANKYDVVISAVDNMEARYLLNDFCCNSNKTLVDGAVEAFWGNVFVFIPHKTACYRMLYSNDIDENIDIGVVGMLPGIIGSIQALEATKIILGIGKTLHGRLMQFDGLCDEWHTINVIQNKNFCKNCERRKINE